MVHLKSLLTLTLALTTSITAMNADSTCDDAYNKCVTAPCANLSTCFSNREMCRHGQTNSPAKLHSPHPERSVFDEDDCQDALSK
ncbi:hypothetical protein N7465_008476 [Penicillium sp. CMV-2018d]|nr:hypothetical protein N7465_008476 [Penicillium sp. CMV-2018d]